LFNYPLARPTPSVWVSLCHSLPHSPSSFRLVRYDLPLTSLVSWHFIGRPFCFKLLRARSSPRFEKRTPPAAAFSPRCNSIKRIVLLPVLFFFFFFFFFSGVFPPPPRRDYALYLLGSFQFRARKPTTSYWFWISAFPPPQLQSLCRSAFPDRSALCEFFLPFFFFFPRAASCLVFLLWRDLLASATSLNSFFFFVLLCRKDIVTLSQARS